MLGVARSSRASQEMFITKITHLDVHGCNGMQELPGVEHLTSLESIDAWKCEKLQSIPKLRLTQLTQLHVAGCNEILELSGVEHLISMKRLEVWGCKKLQSIPWLGKLTNIT